MTASSSARKTSDPLVIGLTGPIASGKSTVAEMLRERGAEIIDADQVYHSLVRAHSPLLGAIATRFGPEVIRADGELDRPALASIVFNDPTALTDLDRITHPAVVAEVRHRLAQSTADYVVVEAVKLTQSGLAADVDSLWLIQAAPEMRVHRLMMRNGLGQTEARPRVFSAGNPLSADVQVDVTIDTSGSLASTRNAVDAAWITLLESRSRDCRTDGESQGG